MTRESRAPLIVAIVLLLLPVLYVGSYLAMVVPDGVYPLQLGSGRYRQHYRVFSRDCDRIYWPLEQIDRRVRPRAWGVMSWEGTSRANRRRGSGGST